MDVLSQAGSLRELWSEKDSRGLLPVLEDINDLLDQGIITADEFRDFMVPGNKPSQELLDRIAASRAKRAARDAGAASGEGADDTGSRSGSLSSVSAETRARKLITASSGALPEGFSFSQDYGFKFGSATYGAAAASGKADANARRAELSGMVSDSKRRRARDTAACDIQRVARGYLGRRHAAEERRTQFLEWSRERSERLRLAQEAEAAAVADEEAVRVARKELEDAAGSVAAESALLFDLQRDMMAMIAANDKAARTMTRAVRRHAARCALQRAIGARDREAAAVAEALCQAETAHNAASAIQREMRRKAAQRGARAAGVRRVEAATTIQRVQRGTSQRRAFTHARDSATKIQAVSRGNTSRKLLKHKQSAAVSMQASFRGFKGRQAGEARRQEVVADQRRLQQRQAAAVGTLQRWARGRLDRSAFLERLAWKRMQEQAQRAAQEAMAAAERALELQMQADAALRIQASFRGHKECASFARQKAGALQVQRLVRGRQGRHKYAYMQLRRRMEESAAVCVQCLYRGQSTRRHLLRRHTSARDVQRTYRGHRARRDVGPKLAQYRAAQHQMRERSAVAIQRVARSASSRRLAQQRRRGAERIGATARGWKARREVATIRRKLHASRIPAKRAADSPVLTGQARRDHGEARKLAKATKQVEFVGTMVPLERRAFGGKVPVRSRKRRSTGTEAASASSADDGGDDSIARAQPQAQQYDVTSTIGPRAGDGAAPLAASVAQLARRASPNSYSVGRSSASFSRASSASPPLPGATYGVAAAAVLRQYTDPEGSLIGAMATAYDHYLQGSSSSTLPPRPLARPGSPGAMFMSRPTSFDLSDHSDDGYGEDAIVDGAVVSPERLEYRLTPGGTELDEEAKVRRRHRRTRARKRTVEVEVGVVADVVVPEEQLRGMDAIGGPNAKPWASRTRRSKRLERRSQTHDLQGNLAVDVVASVDGVVATNGPPAEAAVNTSSDSDSDSGRGDGDDGGAPDSKARTRAATHRRAMSSMQSSQSAPASRRTSLVRAQTHSGNVRMRRRNGEGADATTRGRRPISDGHPPRRSSTGMTSSRRSSTAVTRGFGATVRQRAREEVSDASDNDGAGGSTGRQHTHRTSLSSGARLTSLPPPSGSGAPAGEVPQLALGSLSSGPSSASGSESGAASDGASQSRRRGRPLAPLSANTHATAAVPARVRKPSKAGLGATFTARTRKKSVAGGLQTGRSGMTTWRSQATTFGSTFGAELDAGVNAAPADASAAALGKTRVRKPHAQHRARGAVAAMDDALGRGVVKAPRAAAKLDDIADYGSATPSPFIAGPTPLVSATPSGAAADVSLFR